LPQQTGNQKRGNATRSKTERRCQYECTAWITERLKRRGYLHWRCRLIDFSKAVKYLSGHIQRAKKSGCPVADLIVGNPFDVAEFDQQNLMRTV
jgi:hypothetical protein